MNLLTTQEVMDLLKVRRNTVYRLRESGLPYIKLGRSVRYDREDVIAWVRLKKTCDEVLPRDEEDVETPLLPLRRPPVDEAVYIL